MKAGISANDDTLRYADNLAEAIGKSRSYLYAMKKAGFEMPGGQASVVEAREWLSARPNFSCASYSKGKSKVGRKKEVYLGDLPAGDLEKEILFRDGETIASMPELGNIDQVLIDMKQNQEADDRLNMCGELVEQARADSRAILGDLFLQKIEAFDSGFFAAAAKLIERRKEQARPVDALRMEMMLIKRRSQADGVKYTWDEISDELTYSSGDKKTIEAAARQIGLELIKRPRGRQSAK